ncbi:MAG: glycosyltransferase [Thermoleophilaceae bacterium]|nr:glycosyltransferase [Thermoleophilaceae bacterium]
MSDAPDVTVVVATRNRPRRLERLLDGLADQTLDAGRWNLVVVHEHASGDADTAAVLAEHPLARSGRMASLPGVEGPGPAAMRNVGWRAAHGRMIAFTDDDCRPAPTWLERLLAGAESSPGAIVQGATEPDPEERHLLATRHWVRTQDIDPPTIEAQTCNIAYPRELLERLEGFDNAMLPGLAGEDTDLCLRGIEAGAVQIAAPDAIVYHAVEPFGALGQIRRALRWQGLAYVSKRHPAFRAHYGIFWKSRHPLLLLALTGVLLSTRRRSPLALAIPWLWAVRPPPEGGIRGHLAAVKVIPVKALIDLAELAALARGSVRHRTLFL